MTDWTPDALAADAERRYAHEAAGMCPDSGLTIARCWDSDLCDCSMAPPRRCDFCGVKVWDIEDHRARQQCSLGAPTYAQEYRASFFVDGVANDRS